MNNFLLIHIFHGERRFGVFLLSHILSVHRHALFFWLSGKVKAKIVLAEEFWALSRIAPRPPPPAWPNAMPAHPLTRHAARRHFLRNFFCLSLDSPLATPFLFSAGSCVTPLETFDLAFKQESILCHTWTHPAALYHVYTARWNVCTVTFQTDKV